MGIEHNLMQRHLDTHICRHTLMYQPRGTRDPVLTHFSIIPHICDGEMVSIGSGNDLSPVRCKAIARTNTDVLSIGPLATNFDETRMKIPHFLFKKVHLKNVVCETVAILFRERRVNWHVIDNHIVVFSIASNNKIKHMTPHTSFHNCGVK